MIVIVYKGRHCNGKISHSSCPFAPHLSRGASQTLRNAGLDDLGDEDLESNPLVRRWQMAWLGYTHTHTHTHQGCMINSFCKFEWDHHSGLSACVWPVN